MLSPYRVLDLTNERGLLAAQILSDLGADVIQIEPPGGSSARRIAPFFPDVEDELERSIFWAAYTRNKRGITCNIDSPEGQAIVRRLAAGAHFLFESDPPGAMASRGLGYEDIGAVNPSLVYVSITPFGQDGPKANYADSDLVLWAAGGPLLLTGDHDRPPVRISVPQAYHHAAADAAVGALLAHHERIHSGRGQHVDVSAQQSVAQATLSQILAHSVGDNEPTRAAGGVRSAGRYARTTWEVQDGYIVLALGFGSATGHFTRNLMQWIYEEGGCDEATRDKDWVRYLDLLRSGEEPLSELERIQTLVAEFVATKSKAELFAAARERKLLLVPVATIAEVAASPQYAERAFWQALTHADGRTVRYPGPFVKLTTRPITYRRPPPRLGEHNRDIYIGELGFTETEFNRLRNEGVI